MYAYTYLTREALLFPAVLFFFFLLLSFFSFFFLFPAVLFLSHTAAQQQERERERERERCIRAYGQQTRALTRQFYSYFFFFLAARA